MKIPDPIIEPATSIVASVSVIALTNSRDDFGVSTVAVWVVTLCPLVLGFRPGVSLLYSAQKLPGDGDFC
jgi:hypothetical protein